LKILPVNLHSPAAEMEIVVVLCIILFALGLYFGNWFGRDSALSELKDYRKMLLQKRDLIFKKLADATAHHNKIVAQSKKILSEAEWKELEAKYKLREDEDKARNAYANKEQSIRSIINTTISSHPNNCYVSSVLLDAEETILDKELDDLSDRAPGTAGAIKKKFNEKARQWRLEARYYKFQTLFYESLFPDLKEYSIQEGNPEKPVVHSSDWLPEEEYRNLSYEEKQERAQRALDRYVAGPKSNWEVGRDYELYVGHLFRKAGWKVEQLGVTAKLEDLGRDLICRKPGVTLIVQCKFWSQDKEIHEKHIAQLLGTTLSFAVENNLPSLTLGKIGSNATRVLPIFVTSTRLSETAIRFAKALHVEVRKIEFDPRTTEFPRIKCNIGNDGRIFHLPFDQMYDRAVISAPGERYASTVKEAMKYGFRRAYRWMGATSPASN